MGAEQADGRGEAGTSGGDASLAAGAARGARSALAEHLSTLGWALLVLGGLCLSSLHSYPLFHALAELFSIVVACSIFVIVWNTRPLLDNSYLLFIGVAYLFVGGLDLVHTLAYKGMGVFPGYYPENLATQLWIAARYVEALSLLVATFFIGRRLSVHALLGVYALAFALIIFSIFVWGMFPTCFEEGTGLTAFKKASEYVVCGLLLASVAQLWRHRERFDRGILGLLVASILVTIAGELVFTLYESVHSVPILIGHYLKIVSFYLIYRALIHTGLSRPHALLFRELKQREEELGRSEEELERTVAELEASNADLEQFAHVASHDLQAPLALVDDYARLLGRQFGERLEPQAATYVARIREGVARMQELIRDILTYSRIGSGARPPRGTPCTPVVAVAMRNLRAALRESGGEVTHEALPTVLADERQLLELFQNLIGNALKFRAQAPPQVHIAARREDGWWRFAVRDNGIGIPPGAGERIFGMFERAHGRSDYPGTGIGLAICRKIVERHGGRIWAESSPGHGATFFFTLPAADQAPA
ncbi:MAG: sensor histidine kinase [Candidatus Brocadiia bacterium]